MLYATAGGGDGVVSRVFKSTDAGATWVAVNSGLPDGIALGALAIDPLTPRMLYVVSTSPTCPSTAGCTGGGVFKSTDAGASWSAVNTGLPDGIAVGALAIDPITPHALYAGWTSPYCPDIGCTGGVFKSTDGAARWESLNTGLPNTGVFALGIDPTAPRRLYAGTEYGVFSLEQGPTCIGDCEGTQTVAVNDLITLVNIALGTSQSSACPHGIPSDTVTITLIIQAVNNALNGCGPGQ